MLAIVVVSSCDGVISSRDRCRDLTLQWLDSDLHYEMDVQIAAWYVVDINDAETNRKDVLTVDCASVA